MNDISGLRENNQWCKEKSVVKEKARDFKERFNEDVSQQVRLDNVDFNGILDEVNVMLVGRRTEEEIKHVVWSWDSSKSPGPDGFNF